MHNPTRCRVLLGTLMLLSSVAFCQPAWAASVNPEDEDPARYYDIKNDMAQEKTNDPWEGINRPVFQFNLGFDRYIAKPVILAFDEIPAPVRHRFNDFLNNLTEPLNFIHGVLQLNPDAAFTSFWRFVLNTTFGLGGLRDFAREDAGLARMPNNMGKTLGYYGVPNGPYVVLPILGPSSVRDTSGRVVDWYADPVGWVETDWESYAQAVADGVDARDVNAGVIEHLYYDSIDPYVATRSAYQQHESFKSSPRE